MGTGIASSVVKAPIVADGEVAGAKDYWWMGGPGAGREFEVVGITATPGGDFDRILGAGEDAVLTVRVRSVPELALRVADADKYWSGEIEMPLEVEELTLRRGAGDRGGAD